MKVITGSASVSLGSAGFLELACARRDDDETRACTCTRAEDASTE